MTRIIDEKCTDLRHLRRRLGVALIPRMFGCITTSLKQLAARKLFTLWVRHHVKQNLVDSDTDLCADVLSDTSGYHAGQTAVTAVVSCQLGDVSDSERTHHQSLTASDAEQSEQQCDDDASASSSSGGVTSRAHVNVTPTSHSRDNDSVSQWDMLRKIHQLRSLQLPDVQQLAQQLDTRPLPLDTLECLQVEMLRFQLFLHVHGSRWADNLHCYRDSYVGDYDTDDDSDATSENDSDLEYW